MAKQFEVQIGAPGRRPQPYTVNSGVSVAKALADNGFTVGRIDSVSLNGTVLTDPTKTKLRAAEGAQVVLVVPRINNG